MRTERQHCPSAMEEEVTREMIMQLMKQREEVDQQIQALGGILSSVRNAYEFVLFMYFSAIG
jgi:hypothetical protein